MRPHRIHVSPYVQAGNALVMGWDPEDPDGLIKLDPPSVEDAPGVDIYIHPDDEQHVRDLIAREQETPAWWLENRRLETQLVRLMRRIA